MYIWAKKGNKNERCLDNSISEQKSLTISDLFDAFSRQSWSDPSRTVVFISEIEFWANIDGQLIIVWN